MHARWLVTTLTATWLAGCQTLSPPPPADPMASAPPVASGLDAAGLSTLISAELAGQRGDFARATRGYLEAAQRYHSAALAERATLAARYTDDRELLARAARRWQALAPDAEAPARLLAGLAMERGDWLDSLDQRLTLAAQGGQGDLTGFAETAIEQNVAPAPLIERLKDFLADHADQSDAQLATALLEAAGGDTRSAETRLAQLAERHPELPGLWLARTRLALQQAHYAAARDAARRGLETAPDDSRLALLLAQAQLRLGNVDAAESRINTLLERHADAPELRLALARLYLEEGYAAPAKRLLLPLIEQDDASPASFILLGMIAEAEGEVDNALLYYRQVPPGDGFLDARRRAAQMLAEHDRLADARTFLHVERLRHPDTYGELAAIEVQLLREHQHDAEADALLDRALKRHPDDTQLRFMHSMRRYQQGDIAGMEQDLRRILEQQPDDAAALNALGYTLLDETDRLDEARVLIEKAYRLAPDNPAIIDSMGWLQYKLGRPQQALVHLREAYRRQPDQEIAAHLAEVLWQQGQRADARRLVAEALERFDSRPRIEALIQRIPALSPTHARPE